MAFEVAQSLEALLDLVMVRKISAPGMSEIAIGAVVGGHDPRVIWNERGRRDLSARYLKAQVMQQLRTIELRRDVYFW